MRQDPPRFSDDPAEPELARALREAQGDVLSPEAVARLRGSLTGAGIAVGVAAAGGRRALLAKVLAAAARLRIVGLGIVGLGIAGAFGVASVRHLPSDATAIATAGTARPSAEVPALPASDALPASVPTATTVETSRPVASARPPVASPPTHPAPTVPPAAAGPPSPREGALLLEARRALGADPARALGLVHAHEQEFPGSQLAPERARIAAEARQHLER